MKAFISSWPQLIQIVGAILTAFAAARGTEASHGTLSTLEQIFQVWVSGAGGLGLMGLGHVGQRTTVATANAALPKTPANQDSSLFLLSHVASDLMQRGKMGAYASLAQVAKDLADEHAEDITQEALTSLKAAKPS